MMDRKKVYPDRTDGVIDSLKKDGITFFVDNEDKPCLNIPNGHFRKDWEVGEERVVDLVVMTYLMLYEAYPKKSQIEILLVHIREFCRMHGQRPRQQGESDLQKNPIFVGALLLMNTQPIYHDLTANLHHRITQILSRTPGYLAQSLTPYPHIFGRQLRRLVTDLRASYVRVEFTHKESGSYCKLTRLEGFQVEPIHSIESVFPDGKSRQSEFNPSGVSAMKGTDYDTADEADGRIRIEVEPYSPFDNFEANALEILGEKEISISRPNCSESKIESESGSLTLEANNNESEEILDV